MRLTRNLAFVILAALFVRAQQAPVRAQYAQCVTGWSGCVAAEAQCSPSLIDCNNLCQQNCPRYTGTWTSQGLACDGTANNGCPNPGPNPGQNMFVQGSCNCTVATCYEAWWGCSSNAQCCGGNCYANTYACGVSCSQYCGGDPVCTCQCERGWWDPYGDCTASPILINVTNNGSDHLTSAIDGVLFDISATGTAEWVAWTSADSQVGFLVWDRNQNGVIDNGSELFGTATRLRDGKVAANGFEALREWDSNGDYRIDSSDPIYGKLRLWFDFNHNGYSESDELFSLQSIGITTIHTEYRETPRRDQYGNRYRYEGTAVMLLHKEQVLRRIFDVFFETLR